MEANKMKKTNFNYFMVLGCCAALLLAAFTVTAQRIENDSLPSDSETVVKISDFNEQAARNSIQSGDERRERISAHKVVSFSNHSTVIPYAGSMLVREKEGIYVDFTTSGLTPGTVATLWLAIFNFPENCRSNPCTPSDIFNNPNVNGSLLASGGRIVGPDGTANFAAFRGILDATGAFVGPGLWDARRAEIHLVVRTHGMASSDPAILQQQLNTFNGGCPPNACSNLQVAIHKP